MTLQDLRGGLAKLKMSIAEFGRLCLVSERTVRRWVSGDPPPLALIVLDLILRRKVSKRDVADSADRVRKQIGRL